jgi:NADH:ubiquinone oxidoreductase subunit F (NADH-binding)
MSGNLGRHLQERGGVTLSVLDVGQGAGRAALPPAALRSALSYYADLAGAGPVQGVRVCMGTSCHLAGCDGLYRSLEAGAPCRRVYCLGYCDRSPAVLRADDRPVVRCDQASARLVLQAEPPPPPPEPPLIRCAAPEPIVTRRAGRGDFADLDRARREGAYEGLRRALSMEPAAIVRMLEESGERGRGGAGFPTGLKWRRCAAEPGERYAVANGDEGDPGSFVDRVLMEQDPHGVLEGLAICGYAVGASRGIVFVRSEYPAAIVAVRRAVRDATAAGLLGESVLGSGFGFEVSVVPGLGSYVCGEETALLNAIEGGRGEVRPRPPYPAQRGLYGRPTVVNNVETLVNVGWIVERGAAAFAALGTPESSGTKAICLNHGFAAPGIVEVEFGVPLRSVIEEHAGGGAGGTLLEAVLLGGPMGSVLSPPQWDLAVCYAAMARRGVRLGHGGIVAVPAGTDLRALFLHWLRFMEEESCGKCVPCRLGSRQAHLIAQGAAPGAEATLSRLLCVIAEGSLCAFGQEMPGPLGTMLSRWGDRVLGRKGS